MPKDDDAVETIAAAVAEFTATFLRTEGDDDALALARTQLQAAARRVAHQLTEYQRSYAWLGVTNAGQILTQIMRTDEESVLKETEVEIREAGMRILNERLDVGELDEAWPPEPGIEWDELRVRLTRYMERNVRDLWMLADVGMGETLLEHAFTPVLLFMRAWLDAATRWELLDEHRTPEHLHALEQFLRLPPKP